MDLTILFCWNFFFFILFRELEYVDWKIIKMFDSWVAIKIWCFLGLIIYWKFRRFQRMDCWKFFWHELLNGNARNSWNFISSSSSSQFGQLYCNLCSNVNLKSEFSESQTLTRIPTVLSRILFNFKCSKKS